MEQFPKRQEIVIPDEFEQVIVDAPLDLKTIDALKTRFSAKIFFGDFSEDGKTTRNAALSIDPAIRDETLAFLANSGRVVRNTVEENRIRKEKKERKRTWFEKKFGA